jgi:hypothetical protein
MLKKFVDPKIRRVFERQIVRYLKEPQLWNPKLIKPERLYLIYGQSGMKDCVDQLMREHQMEFWVLDVSKNIKEVEAQLIKMKELKEIPVLLILNAELLAIHHSLFLDTHNLKQFQNVKFFIAITTEIPNQQYAFWDQFKVRIPMGIPNDRTYYVSALKYYFGEWARHWPFSKVLLNEEDYDKLADACDFCTLKDVKKFTRRCFKYVMDVYPEENVDITLKMLENPNNFLMFASMGVSDVMCIVPHDAYDAQRKYDSTLSREASEAVYKRRKIDETMVEIE